MSSSSNVIFHWQGHYIARSSQGHRKVIRSSQGHQVIRSSILHRKVIRSSDDLRQGHKQGHLPLGRSSARCFIGKVIGIFPRRGISLLRSLESFVRKTILHRPGHRQGQLLLTRSSSRSSARSSGDLAYDLASGYLTSQVIRSFQGHQVIAGH